MKRRMLAVALLLLLSAFALPAQTCLACSCGLLPPAEKFAQADVVVRARVVATSGKSDGYAWTGARLRVATSWKGAADPEIVVIGHDLFIQCTGGFVWGEEYLIYANGPDPDALTVEICAGLRRFDYTSQDPNLQADFAYLGPGTPVSGGQAPPLIAFGMVNAARIAAGLAWSR